MDKQTVIATVLAVQARYAEALPLMEFTSADDRTTLGGQILHGRSDRAAMRMSIRQLRSGRQVECLIGERLLPGLAF